MISDVFYKYAQNHLFLQKKIPTVQKLISNRQLKSVELIIIKGYCDGVGIYKADETTSAQHLRY